MGLLHRNKGNKTKTKRHKEAEHYRRHKADRIGAYEEYDSGEDGYFEEDPEAGYYEEAAEDGYYEEEAEDGYDEEALEDGYYEEDPEAGYYEEVAEDGYYEEEAEDGYDEETLEDGYYEKKPEAGYYEEAAEEAYYEEDPEIGYEEEVIEDTYYEEDPEAGYEEEAAEEAYYEEDPEAGYEEDASDPDFYGGEIRYVEGEESYEDVPEEMEFEEDLYDGEEGYEDPEDIENFDASYEGSYDEEGSGSDIYDTDEYIEAEYDEEEYDKDYSRIRTSKNNRRSGKKKREKERSGLSVVDILLGLSGIAVAAVVIIALSRVGEIRTMEKKVDSFEGLVVDLEDAGVIGQRGLIAMNIAMLSGGTNIQEEDTVVVIPEDTPVAKTNVALKTASVVKDLKIKFTNASSGKLIASVPFKVLVKTPSGKEVTWEDEDRDGIIYYSGIEGGTYTLTMAALEEQYSDYQVDSVTQKVDVKAEIAYQKVDVADEVKTEAEVNVAQEDTAIAQQDTVTESVLTDTVEFVASSATEGGDGTYSEIAKSTIPDPATLTGVIKEGLLVLPATENAGNPTEDQNTSEGNNTEESGSEESTSEESKSEESTSGESSTEESKTEESKTEESTAEESRTEETKEDVKTEETKTVTGSVSLEPASLTLKVNETAALKATAKQITKTKTVTTRTVTGKDPVTETVEKEDTEDISSKVSLTSSDTAIAEIKDGQVKALKAGSARITAKVTVDGKEYTAECALTVQEADTLTLSASSLTIEVGKTGKLTVNILPKDTTFTVATSDEKILKAAVSGTEITLTGVAAGDAKITVTGSNKLSAVCDVKVSAEPALTFEETKLTVGFKKTLTVKASLVPDTAKITKAESSDTNIATVTVKEKELEITGVATGTCKITVTADNEKTAELEITVTNSAANDTTTKLKDASGNQVYVLENDAYREAVYADYYKDGIKFYLMTPKKLYTGWQTIGGKTYYYKADHTFVTGKQIIQGAEYVFGEDGAIPTGAPVLGIDVSKWNGTIDWNSVSTSGISYAIIRCGYRGSSSGALIVDPKFETNISKAKAAGIQVGVYFFTQAVSETEAVEEASMVLSQVSKYSLNYPIYLDVESSGGRGDKLTKEQRTAVIKAFCNTIQNSGYTAGVYANKTWLAEKMDVSQLGSARIWLAQYAAAPTYTGRYNMWQYTSKGTLPGITGDVDMNLNF